MREKEYIAMIKKILQSEYIGDDCAYLSDLGIVISQDNLVEDVHFKKEYMTPYQLGYKSVMVNLSDIASSGASPSYITVGLSIPKDINNDFIKDFYQGAKLACGDNVKIVGGDITSSDKIFISISAIGNSTGRNISSRKNAKVGYKIIVSGEHGSSCAGLRLLLNKQKLYTKFIKAHLEPKAQIEFGSYISTHIHEQYAMMDTSDGLMETLSTISNESRVLLDIDFSRIPHDENIKKFANWQDMVLFGGEDYQLVAAVPQNFNYGIKIGDVKTGSGISLNIDGTVKHYTKEDVNAKIYNHFGDKE